MADRHLLLGLLFVVLLTLAGSSATTISATEPTANETDVFISDKPDPEAGSVPPFVLPELENVDQVENISVAELSEIRDFYYSTTEPPYRVGTDQKTLHEYRLEQLQSISNDPTLRSPQRNDNRDPRTSRGSPTASS